MKKETEYLEVETDTTIEGVKEHIYMISQVKVLGLQVCTTIPPDQVNNLELLKEQLNNDYPCGTENGWFIELESPAPVKCNDVKGRYHYICPC